MKRPHSRPTRLTLPRRRRAVALLMAISVLAALVAISVPFLLSMILHGRSARVDLSAAQAQAGAEGAVAHGLAHLYRNLLKAPGYDPSPTVDVDAELQVPMGLPMLNVSDSNGELWSCKIEDEQGKVNLNSAPPNLIGNLLGSTTLTEPAVKGGTELLVADASVFASDGNPETVDGVIGIDGDAVPYCHVQGSTILLKPDSNNYLMRAHRRGALVFDGRAFWIADYKRQSGQSVFRPFRSVYEAKAAGQGHPVLAIKPDEFAAIEPFITVHSGRDGPQWGRAEIVTGFISAQTQGFRFQENRGFGPGTMIRLAQHGQTATCARIVGAFTSRDGLTTSVELDQQLGMDLTGSGVGNEIQIEPELRHPININTAPVEVVRACLIGVGLRGDTVTMSRAQADALARLLKERTYGNSEELMLALSDASKKGIISKALMDAAFINATEPNSPKVRGNTVAFCFRSYGSFTIEGSAVLSTESGVPLARSTLRQVVSLPTPPPGQFELKSQEDFQKLVDKGLTQKVVTWPVALNDTARSHGDARHGRVPDPNHGALRLTTGKVGSHNGRNILEEWIEHCEDPVDRGFFQEGYDLTKRGGTWKLGAFPDQRGYMPTTGIEMWYRPYGTANAVFFDMAESQDRNRVLFQYEPGDGLTITIWDANLQKKSVRYVWPFTMDRYEWYHIAGSWRTSWPGGQEIRVDANPIPLDPYKGNQQAFQQSTTLSSDLDVKAFQVLSVKDADTAELPTAGAVQVGDEVIEYTERTGGSLTGNAFKPTPGLRRGSRMTTAYTHKADEPVMRYGYFNTFVNDHPEGRGLLAEELPIKTSTTVQMPSPPNPTNFVLDTDTKEIPVVDASDFPKSGFVNVGGEIIYYEKKDTSKAPHKLQNLARAQSIGGHAAPARNLYHGTGVNLCSVAITDSSLYNPSGIVQIDSNKDARVVEWLDYDDKRNVNGKHFLLAKVSGVGIGDIRRKITEEVVHNQSSLGTSFRGSKGTAVSAHDAREKVIPVAQMSGPQCGDQQSPYGESIQADINTVSVVTRGQNDGDLRFIKRAYVNQWAVTRDIWRAGSYVDTVFVNWAFEYWAGLDDFVNRRYPAGQAGLLRWPSGELPNFCSERHIAKASDGGGSLEGEVDELKVLSLPSQGAKIARVLTDFKSVFPDDKGFASQDAEMYLEESHGWAHPGGSNFNPQWPASGFIRVDDEFIFYTRLEQFDVTHVADRGVQDPKDPNRLLTSQDDKLTKRTWRHPKTPDNPAGPTDEVHPNVGDKQANAFDGVTTSKNKPQDAYDERKTLIKLSGLHRGLLNTDAADHTVGAGVMLYDAAPFTVLSGGMAGDAKSFKVLDDKGFPRDEGYAWIGSEVVGWYKQGYQVDVFRGRFGTSSSDHGADELVRCLPFRYWDRNAKEYDGNGLAFMQSGYFATDAIWQSVEIDVGPGTSSHHIMPLRSHPRILVRFNGQPGWDQAPTNRDGGIYQFGGHGKFPLRGRAPGGGVAGDQIEIRIFWQYDKGAFLPQPDWKRCFAVTRLRATYYNPLVVRRVDEVERK